MGGSQVDASIHSEQASTSEIVLARVVIILTETLSVSKDACLLN